MIIDLQERYPSPYQARALRAITKAIFHHSATPAQTTPAGALSALDAIYRYHTQTNGWPGAGYHFAVSAGQVYQLNSLDEISYHVAYHNDDTVGICFIGSYEQSSPPEVDLAAARELMAHLEALLGRELAIRGHAEENPASTAFCPSRKWSEWRVLVMPDRRTEEEAYFSTFGVPANPESAIYRYWLGQKAIGANMGPAVTGEMDGEPFGESGNIVQRFANAVVVCKPAEGWACYRAQVVLEPGRWLPGLQ